MKEKSARTMRPESYRKAIGSEYNRRGFSSLLILVILALGTVAGTMAIFQLRSRTTTQPQPTQTPQISNPTQTPTQATSSAQKEEITSWKTYRNEKYLFEIKHPSYFIVEEGSPPFSSSTIFFRDKLNYAIAGEGPGPGIKVFPYYFVINIIQSKLSIQDYINDPLNLRIVGKKIIDRNEFTIADEGIEIKYQPERPLLYQYYLIKKADTIIFITNPVYSIEVTTFEKILSTFKFI